MRSLDLFGLLAVSAMLLFYALERRGAWTVFGFATACAAGSVYGFLQGAWPFGVVEAIWAVVALRRWKALSRASLAKDDGILREKSGEPFMAEPSPQRRRTLEREIIIAVVVLYLLITGVMVAVHYLQPAGQATATSSASPSHGGRSAQPSKTE